MGSMLLFVYLTWNNSFSDVI